MYKDGNKTNKEKPARQYSTLQNTTDYPLNKQKKQLHVHEHSEKSPLSLENKISNTCEYSQIVISSK